MSGHGVLLSSCSASSATHVIDGRQAKQIGPPAGRQGAAVAGADHVAGGDRNALLVAERIDVTNRAEMDVGGVVPGIGKMSGYRLLPPQRQEELGLPVAYVGKGTDSLYTDPAHIIHHAVGVALRL